MTKSDKTTLSYPDLDRVREEAMDFANVGIYRYRFSGEIVFMDRGCLRLLDLEDTVSDPSQLCGRDIGSLFEYIDAPERLRSATKQHKSVRNFEYHFKTLSGKERWSYHTSYLVHDEETGEEMLQVIVQDITRLKAAIKSLGESESRYRALAEQSAQGIFVILIQDPRIVFANAALSKITGYPIETITSMSSNDIWKRIHPDDLSAVEGLYENRREGNGFPSEYEVRMRCADDTYRWFSLVVSVIVYEGQPASQVSVTDIDNKKKEAELRRTQALNLQHMQKLESLGVLAGGIAHDFNNLLAVVMANADLACRMPETPRSIYEQLENIVTVSGQASELCGQLLSYAGQQSIEKKAIQLSSLFSETLPLLKVSISKKIQLNYEDNKNLPMIEGDPSQIRQILLNLITNASEAVGDEIGIIEVKSGVTYLTEAHLEKMRLGDELLAGSYVFMEVQDTGIGMDRETQERIFDPFFTTKFIGRGLGLAAVLGILRAHQATFEIDSAPGRGTRFKIFLPTMKASTVPALSYTTEEPVMQKISGRVLCVDDEPKVLNALASILKYFGLEVITAIDGEDALEKFRKHKDNINIAILDVAMPKRDGIELFKELRAINPSLPVLFASGYNKDSRMAAFGPDSLTDFLRKPFTIAALGKSLDALLNRTHK